MFAAGRSRILFADAADRGTSKPSSAKVHSRTTVRWMPLVRTCPEVQPEISVTNRDTNTRANLCALWQTPDSARHGCRRYSTECHIYGRIDDQTVKQCDVAYLASSIFSYDASLDMVSLALPPRRSGQFLKQTDASTGRSVAYLLHTSRMRPVGGSSRRYARWAHSQRDDHLPGLSTFGELLIGRARGCAEPYPAECDRP